MKEGWNKEDSNRAIEHPLAALGFQVEIPEEILFSLSFRTGIPASIPLHPVTIPFRRNSPWLSGAGPPGSSFLYVRHRQDDRAGK